MDYAHCTLLACSQSIQTFNKASFKKIAMLSRCRYHSFQKASLCMPVLSNDLASYEYFSQLHTILCFCDMQCTCKPVPNLTLKNYDIDFQ